MFGLFRNTYDYHEWHDLIAVSAIKENLVREVSGEEDPLLEGAEQAEAKENQDDHYEIHEVNEI